MSSRAMVGIAVAGVLCCGVPVLLLTLGLTTAGTFLLVNRFYILGGMIVLMGIFMWIGWKARNLKQQASSTSTSTVHTNHYDD